MKSLKNKKILITCGPTWVSLDAVRVMSNQSSGELGHILAMDCQKAGAEVTLLEGPVQNPLKAGGIKVVKFVFFEELAQLLKRELRKKYDVLIHAAAVADYRPAKVFPGKIDSAAPQLNLKFIRTPKLINTVKKIAPKIFLIGFKLEPKVGKHNFKKITKKLFNEARCDLAVANSSNKRKYSGYLVDCERRVLAHAASRQKLSQNLITIIKEKI